MLGLLKKRWRQLTGILIGAAITPLAVGAAVVSAGAGHGSYAFAKLLFPYSMLFTLFADNTISHPLIGCALVQFPIYGLVITSFDATKAIIVLAILHVCCVVLCFSGLLPNFS